LDVSIEAVPALDVEADLAELAAPVPVAMDWSERERPTTEGGELAERAGVSIQTFRYRPVRRAA
jgi:hypothetical protein